MRFHACKTVLGARKRADVHSTNNKVVCGRNCTKIVLKLLAAKNRLSISILCNAPFIFVYMMTTLHPCTLQNLLA